MLILTARISLCYRQALRVAPVSLYNFWRRLYNFTKGSRLVAASPALLFLMTGGESMPEPQYMSQSKLDELMAELTELRTVRKPAVSRQINLARTSGGTDDNAEQELARQDLAFVEGKIRSLESLINNAVVEDATRTGGAPSGTVALWRIVTVERENGQQVQYQITGSLEADPGQGRISHVSPIGKSLLGKKPGDITEIQIPNGKTKLKIISVS